MLLLPVSPVNERIFGERTLPVTRELDLLTFT